MLTCIYSIIWIEKDCFLLYNVSIFTTDQRLQAELEEMRAKLLDVQNLGEDLIKNRGEHCKTQVEPKLNQLSQRFEMVARRILHGQVTIKLLRHVKTLKHDLSHQIGY